MKSLKHRIVYNQGSKLKLRARFVKKIQDWILKSERILKRILRFFSKQINSRSLEWWYVKGTEKSTLEIFSLYVSQRYLQHDSVPFFSLTTRFITILLRREQKDNTSSGRNCLESMEKHFAWTK